MKPPEKKVLPVKTSSDCWNPGWTTLYTVWESQYPVREHASWFHTNTSPLMVRWLMYRRSSLNRETTLVLNHLPRVTQVLPALHAEKTIRSTGLIGMKLK